MTVICWDGKTLAADSLHSFEDFTVAYHASKITIVRQNAIATVGCETHAKVFEDWVEDGMKTEHYPKDSFDDDFNGIILSKEGTLTVYYGKSPNPSTIYKRASFGHEGAQHYANALMDHCGMNSVAAAEHACGYSLVCDKPVYSITKDILKRVKSDYRGLWTGTLPDELKK